MLYHKLDGYPVNIIEETEDGSLKCSYLCPQARRVKIRNFERAELVEKKPAKTETPKTQTSIVQGIL